MTNAAPRTVNRAARQFGRAARALLLAAAIGALVFAGSAIAQLSDSIPANKQGQNTQGFNYGYNGTTFDRWRNNVDTGALLTLTAQGAGTVNSTDQVNYNGRGLKCLVNITAISGTSPTVTVAIQYKDTSTGAYTPLLTSAALNAVASTMLTVYPGVAVTANVSASDVLPRTWRISAVIGGTSPSATATVGCSVIAS